jgi:signal peptidase II
MLAWHSRSAWIWLSISLVLSLFIDLWSKSAAFQGVADSPVVVLREDVMRVKQEINPRAITQELIPFHEPMVVVPELLHFTLVLNPGAVFGMGPGQRLFFITFTLVALGFGMWMFATWTGPRDRAAHIGIGMIIGGGIGNLYDRLVYACVRDFIHPLPGWRWPQGTPNIGPIGGGEEVWPYVSNLADLFLLIGIVLLLRHLWFKDRVVTGMNSVPVGPPAARA